MDSINFFRKILEDYNDGPKAVGWNSTDSQELRFKVLTEIGNLEGKSILDVGCGTGDLYKYVTYFTAYAPEYTGYDIVLEMVDAAKKKYPTAKFVKEFPEDKFDYIFASGLFNLPSDTWQTDTLNLIEKMFNHCNLGVGVNFLSVYSKKHDNISKYTDPQELVKFVSMLSDRWVLRNDYKNNDFTFYIYK